MKQLLGRSLNKFPLNTHITGRNKIFVAHEIGLVS